MNIGKNRDFRDYECAVSYARDMKSAGYRAYIEEFYDFDGRYYTVLVWEA